jgi:hypothetical protein
MKKYSSFPKLLKSFGSDNLYDFGRSLYKAIDCGPWTTALLRDGAEVYYGDDLPVGFDPLNVTALKIGSIVEGSDVEVGPVTLTFPFSEEEFNDAVESINNEAKFYWERDNLDTYRIEIDGVEVFTDVGGFQIPDAPEGVDSAKWSRLLEHLNDVTIEENESVTFEGWVVERIDKSMMLF